MKRRDYSNGGSVRGPGGPRADAVKAWLSNDEYVLPADTVRQVGLPALDQLRMATHRFADGGLVKRYADGGYSYGGTGISQQQAIDQFRNNKKGQSFDQAIDQVSKNIIGKQQPITSFSYGVGATPQSPATLPADPGSGFQVPPSTRRASIQYPLAFLDGAPNSTTGKPGAVVAPPASGIISSPDFSARQDAYASKDRGDALVQRVPTMNAQDYQRSNGGTLVDVMPVGINPGQRVVTGNSWQNGVQGRSGALPTPTYQTDYTIFGQNGPQGTASITGPNQRRGGGTLSVMDQGNGGTVDGNVAALNRQIEAIRSLREAQNPGITTGMGAFAQHQGLPRMDPFTRPTDSAGDGPARQQEYESLMRRAATDPGLTAKQRAMMVESAQGLIAPGLAQGKQRGELCGQQMDANQRQQAAQWAAQQQAAQLGLDQQKQGFEQQKWGQQYGLNQLNALTGAQQRGAQTQEAQLRAQGLARTQKLIQAYSAIQEEARQNGIKNDPRLAAIKELILLSQHRNEPADPNAWMQQLISDTAATQ